jgi:hypothetical protein
MKKILGLLLVATGLITGCVTDPLHQSRINSCSREANAHTVSTRIGNSAYWSCLNREEAKQNAPKPIVTQAQQRSTQISSQIKSSAQSTKTCYDQARTSASGQIVTKSILVVTDDQANKFDLFSSKLRLNESQRKALKEYLSSASVCRKILIDGNAGLPFQSIMAKDFAARDLIYTKLLTGQMTIGEANLTIQQQNIKYREERQAEATKLDQNLKNQNTVEIQNIQRQRQLNIENQQRQQLIEDKKRQSNLDAYRTFTAPPPPMQIIQPGTVRGDDIRCTPDGSGGFNCR